MKFIKFSQLSAALLSAYSVQAYANELVIFGDSLSDIGQSNWNRPATYLNGNGKPNKLYTQQLANAYHTNIIPSSQGGRNYAYSGGVILGQHTARLAEQEQLTIGKQVEHYLQKGVNPDAMHILWAGGNDLSAVLSEVVQKENSEERQAYVESVINEMSKEMATQIKVLKQHGVKQIIVPVVPDISQTPAFFEEFGKAFSSQTDKKAKEYVSSTFGNWITWLLPNIKNELNDIYKEQMSSLLDHSQVTPEEFKQLREDVLNETVTTFFKNHSLIAGYLKNSDYSEQKIKETLLDQYKEVLYGSMLLTQLFNASVTKALNQAGGNVVRINTMALFDEMMKKPQAYGLDKVLLPICSSSTADPNNDPCQPDSSQNPDSYLFADSFHPGPRAHQAMADYIQNILQTPQELAALPTLLSHQSEQARDFLRQTYSSDRQYQGMSVQLSYEKQHGDMTHLQVAYHFTPNWQWQIQFSQGKEKLKEGKTHIKDQAKLFQTALRYNQDNYWLGGLAGVNHAKFDIDRISQIGLSTHYQQGKTDGTSLDVGVFGGYEYQLSSMALRLSGDLTYSHTEIEGWHNGDDPLLAMYIKNRTQQSWQAGLDLGLYYQIEAFKPYITTRITKNWINSGNQIDSYFNGAKFSTTLDKPKTPYKLAINLGSSYQAKTIPLIMSFNIYQQVNEKKALEKDTKYTMNVQYRF